jgi:hypothetical protein
MQRVPLMQFGAADALLQLCSNVFPERFIEFATSIAE